MAGGEITLALLKDKIFIRTMKITKPYILNLRGLFILLSFINSKDTAEKRDVGYSPGLLYDWSVATKIIGQA
jgi:hypothetical protein